MKVASFAEIEEEFIRRVHTMVLCSAATVDTQGRPRSRVLHPIWEGATGWIGTHRNSFKARHLANNPYISLAYIADPNNPVYADCRAEWVDDAAVKQHVWDLFKNAPPPLGYDPGTTFSMDEFGVLKLTPWRIDIVSFPSVSHDAGTRTWRPETA